MESFQSYVNEYKKQLEQGSIQKAYKGLMEYILALRAHFNHQYPDYFVPASIYFGYMDMTYFSFTPASLKNRNLKIAIVFLHEAFRFEVWLAGANKQVQAQTWKQIKDSGWNRYPLVPSIQGEDAILQQVLVADPDFSNLEALTGQIEQGTLEFIREVEGFLSGM